MSFRLVPKSVILNDLERQNGPYFALFHRIRVRCRRKTIIRLNSVSKLLLIVYDHINTICAIIILAKLTLITRFDERRCMDDWMHRLPLTLSYGRN